MFRGIEQKSCASAWAAACMSIMGTMNEGYNVVIDVANPETHDANDNEVIHLVDRFLKLHEQSPDVTVANTIFPQSLYEAHGSPEFYKIYHRDFDRFSRESKNCGQYFDRMTRWKVAGGDTIYPLQDLVAKRKRNEEKKKRVKGRLRVGGHRSVARQPGSAEECRGRRRS